MPQDNEVATVIRTLLVAGFLMSNVSRKPNYLAITARRVDEFGIAARYLIAYAGENTITAPDCEALVKVAAHDKASLIVVGRVLSACAGAAILSKAELFGRVGGPVNSTLPLEPEYSEHLFTLAQNRLPDGLIGRPDDLFEIYVHAGLQFLLRGRVIRYGQERRFEVLPDGAVFTTNPPPMLYDCKAAEIKYDLTRVSIRQFSDYVRQFHERYAPYIGRLHAFLLISSEFQDEKSLQERSNELYAECSIPLVCMTAGCLAETVRLFGEHPAYRIAMDWRKIFIGPIVDPRTIQQNLGARKRDHVIREYGS